MKTEMSIKVNIDSEDKEKLDAAYCVLYNIECALSSWERSGYYPYADGVDLPQTVLNIIGIAERLSKLRNPGYHGNYYSNEWMGV